VPLIIKWPGNKHAGIQSGALVSNIDLAPTFLAAAGAAEPAGMDGRDLAAGVDDRDIIFAESHHGFQVMARTKSHKLILHTRKKTALFYDLEKDPQELDNRIGDPAYKEEISRLRKALEDWRGLDNIPEVYVNEDAPIIDAPNVPKRNSGHREVMQEYTAKKMKALLEA